MTRRARLHRLDRRAGAAAARNGPRGAVRRPWPLRHVRASLPARTGSVSEDLARAERQWPCHPTSAGAPGLVPALLLPRALLAADVSPGPRFGVVPGPLPGEPRGLLHRDRRPDRRRSGVLRAAQLPPTTSTGSRAGSTSRSIRCGTSRRRRLLLANAAAFFQARGTIRGVSLALRFVLDRCIDASAFAIPQPPALSAARIVEAYRTRSTPGVVFGDPSDQAGPRTVVPTPRWTPDQGRDVLIAGWLAFLEQQGLTGIWQALLAEQGQTLRARIRSAIRVVR